MDVNLPPRKVQTAHYSPPRASPLRHLSNASTISSSCSTFSNPYLPSRTSTVSSTESTGLVTVAGHKRGISEAGMSPSVLRERYGQAVDSSPAGTYKSTRQSLRPLPQPPVAPSLYNSRITKSYSTSLDTDQPPKYQTDGQATRIRSREGTPQHGHSNSLSSSCVDSATPLSTSASRFQGHHKSSPSQSVISQPDLTDLQNSSTSYLRTLSKFAQSASDEYSISSPCPSVAGLQGRRQLKRTDSTRASRGTVALNNGNGYTWAGRNWMDQQRQFLQAYEYLCHIGEAKEWIEDIIQKPIPPIVQLEEALRDGVTLAEIVQALVPSQHVRIFHHPKLQFRHSDNIVCFFRFLGEVELPELFRFELIDLYEKKNIPKVIYCIHALSWLLYRNGMVGFRIGNLVGQLQFEHHELEEMQKGLDKAGVNMPSFSGMGASFGAEPEVEIIPEPEPKPKESEEDRIHRELSGHQTAILDLQAQIRGASLRMQLGQMMQKFWDSEEMLIELQSRIRGDWARQISDYRSTMKRFAVRLQSAARGHIARAARHHRGAELESQKTQFTAFQSLVRARQVQKEIQQLQSKVKTEDPGVRYVQAAIRGRLERQRIHQEYTQARDGRNNIERLQADVRGALIRLSGQKLRTQLNQCQKNVVSLQAAARAMAARSKNALQVSDLRSNDNLWRALQAASRRVLQQRQLSALKNQLESHQPGVTAFQAYSRGLILRSTMKQIKSSLSSVTSNVVLLQAASRAHVIRVQQAAEATLLKSRLSYTMSFQSHIRGFLLRRHRSKMLAELDSHLPDIEQLQALSRAMLVRIEVGALLARLEGEENVVATLQAAIRGKMIRLKLKEKSRFFRKNMDKVIKVQSFVRAKLQGQAYKTLTCGANPPVGIVKGFVYLLNDSDFDFDEEVEFERIRKTVVQQVRQNELADQYITQLDIKIALLVKNKITLDEVVKHQKHFGGSVGSLLTSTEISSKDPFDLKALNKNSRKKLELYQELFFLLQTQPQYLARLFKKIREQATAERECQRVKHLIMGLFGYAQKRREEYYLLKVMTRSIRAEVDSCESIQDYLRGNFFWAKVFGAYIKSPRDRKFMRDLLCPIVKESVIDNPDLDLESDPMQIYLSAIENEQLRTGQRSRRPTNIPREEAIRDEETKRTFIAHLQDLRDIADQFFAALEELLYKLPYGVRYLAQQMFQSLVAKFQDAEQGHVLQIVGHWLWKAYLQPALLEPEKFGVVDRGLAPNQKRNLEEVAKVLGQAAAGRLFGAEHVFLQPLNSYVGESIERLSEIWNTLMQVPDAETQFDIDEFNDLYAKTKPTLYIKMADIFSIHHIVTAEMASICPNQDDVLRDVVRELGSSKNNEIELMSVSSSEICLTLNPKLHNIEDPDAEIKALFVETKRCVLFIIRVQSGANLMEIMVKPITAEDEDRWYALVREELSMGSSRKRSAYAEANTLIDIAAMSYADLKRTALENVLQLEQLGRLSRHNHYQDLLNAIAVDIRTKHRRRIQRQRELEGVRLTLARLNEQAVYLDQQLSTYNDYIEQAMVTLQNKKGKKRFLVPFTKQWEHERELQRSGRVPKFGSFKYSAQELANRGILVSWQGFPEREWYKLDLTFSSNEVGVFNIDGSNGSISIPGASAQISLDDLLQAQYNNTQFLEFFGATLKVNVNLFLHLIMRKFYKDRDS